MPSTTADPVLSPVSVAFEAILLFRVHENNREMSESDLQGFSRLRGDSFI